MRNQPLAKYLAKYRTLGSGVRSISLAALALVSYAVLGVLLAPSSLLDDAEAATSTRKATRRSASTRSRTTRKARATSTRRKAAPAKRAPRYAYPLELFMMEAPEYDRSALPAEESAEAMRAFVRGTADKYHPRTMVRAGVFKHYPLKGGIYWRREPIKYIIMHSTETGRPVSATRVIESWNSLGRRHPGAQYVVERDGTIYQAVDPDLATVHINIFKTLPGINNDNCIGIEMNHTGSQDYPEVQLQSVIRLVTYLQEHYNIAGENIITHRYAQQGDHTDPVAFDWTGFISRKDKMRMEALALKGQDIEKAARFWKDRPAVDASELAGSHEPESKPSSVRAIELAPDPEPTTVLQPHRQLQEPAPSVEAENRKPVAIPTRVQPGKLRGPIELSPDDLDNFVIPELDSL